MADTIEIAGKREPKWVVYGVAAGGAVVAYFVWKQHKASAAASSSASGTVTDPSTGVQYPANGVDPTTGETYSQEIGQYGSVEAADASVSAADTNYLGDSGNLYGTGYSAEDYSTGTYGAGTTVSGSIYTSNSAWAQAVTAGLTDIGYTGTDVAAALGLYLTGLPLTTDQAAIVQAAIAEYGAPPVGSFQVINQPSGNTSSATTVAVPNVVGDSLADAQSAIQAAGLTFSGPSTGSTVASQSPAAGTQVQPGSTVTVTASGSTTTPPPASGSVTVPNVVGMSYMPDAYTALMAQGLAISISNLPAAYAGTAGFSTAGWTVQSQSPAAGAQVQRGSTVSVTVNAPATPQVTK